ncbi:MAG: SDR family NAD(P)-dependent oxidoreductase [Proteobacteria bacterium]|nr:SDR family NAD(P)-dependent oxidoreductase [Pseudomonadota bacterium]MDA1332120.1 SDR family NAD(P)-dependent oxidoreductase [Pseudomonadota bacterium]
MKPLIETLETGIRLDDKSILITGASGGIGRALALSCADLGATVLLSGRNVNALNETYDLIKSKGNHEPATLELDLCKATEIEFENINRVIKANIGPLHGLVHCATHITELGPIRNLGLSAWQSLLKVNVIAPALLIQACEPLFEASGSGSVVLTSDTHALSLDAYWGGYAVSKSALNAYAKLQSNEWKNERPYRVNVITPGPINSPLRSKTHPGEDRNLLRSIDSLLSTYIYLLSDSSSHVSGENFGYSP